MVVGVGKAPLSFTPGLMVGRELQINGAMTGTAIELEKTLNFSLLVAVRAQIETRSLAQAQEAYEKCVAERRLSAWFSPWGTVEYIPRTRHC
ncbi:hypothetical protein M3O75_10230 [Klebsiella pneumoniae]|nr:hypothetical protein [Klebsiella pneumoniae]